MTTSPLILGVDTATLGGSVSIARGKVVLASRVGDAGVSHSNSLLRDIKECLQRVDVTLGEVDLFAAASGPGSFTGLRIGLATVKGLAATLKRGCIGIPTLHAVAHAAGPSVATVALLSAGRGEVFVQLFSVSTDHTVTPLDAAAHLSPRQLLEKYASLKNLTWTGPGAHAHRDFLREYAREQRIEFNEVEKQRQGWLLVSEQANLSKHVTALAFQRFESGDVVEPQSLSAIYVRPSDAELKWQ
ncbi:MAG: tRNA (adenosine(37)-N6)-threonylcarbamoyltransferase complex dimerization subunit type 1 TsaB [Pyrinomonadaceae bacterium]